MLVFRRREKMESPDKNLLEKGQQPMTKLAHEGCYPRIQTLATSMESKFSHHYPENQGLQDGF